MKKRFASWYWWIALANFACFFLSALWIGGSAFNTHPVAGRYFVENHGRATEVTQLVWYYSYIHSCLAFLMLLSSLLLHWDRKTPR